MTKNQTNRKEMQEDVLAYLDAHKEKWNSIPAVGALKVGLTEITAQINATQQQQNKAQVFIGRSKNQLKRIIAEKADILNDQVEVYASLTGDLALAGRMTASMSDFINLRNDLFVVKVKEVVTEVEGNLEALSAQYGVNEAQVADLKTDLDGFLEMQGMPRAYQVQSVVATSSLDDLFVKANEVLQKLDKVMKIFKHRDSNLYKGYLASRVLVDN